MEENRVVRLIRSTIFLFIKILEFMIPQIIVLYKLDINIIISNFIIRNNKGIRWTNRLRKSLDWDWFDGNISDMLWAILINIKIEKDAVERDIIKMVIIIDIFHCRSLDIIIISLIILIVGGAEMLIAIKINHQNIRLGKELINPLKEIIFRVWYFE